MVPFRVDLTYSAVNHAHPGLRPGALDSFVPEIPPFIPVLFPPSVPCLPQASSRDDPHFVLYLRRAVSAYIMV